jgi:hypothetical protein
MKGFVQNIEGIAVKNEDFRQGFTRPVTVSSLSWR